MQGGQSSALMIWMGEQRTPSAMPRCIWRGTALLPRVVIMRLEAWKELGHSSHTADLAVTDFWKRRFTHTGLTLIPTQITSAFVQNCSYWEHWNHPLLSLSWNLCQQPRLRIFYRCGQVSYHNVSEHKSSEHSHLCRTLFSKACILLPMIKIQRVYEIPILFLVWNSYRRFVMRFSIYRKPDTELLQAATSAVLCL